MRPDGLQSRKYFSCGPTRKEFAGASVGPIPPAPLGCRCFREPREGEVEGNPRAGRHPGRPRATPQAGRWQGRKSREAPRARRPEKPRGAWQKKPISGAAGDAKASGAESHPTPWRPPAASGGLRHAGSCRTALRAYVNLASLRKRKSAPVRRARGAGQAGEEGGAILMTVPAAPRLRPKRQMEGLGRSTWSCPPRASLKLTRLKCKI